MLGLDISLRRTIINRRGSKASMTVLKKAPGRLWLSQVGISWSTSSLMVQSVHEPRLVDSFASLWVLLRFTRRCVFLYKTPLTPIRNDTVLRNYQHFHTSCVNIKSRFLSTVSIFLASFVCFMLPTVFPGFRGASHRSVLSAALSTGR